MQQFPESSLGQQVQSRQPEGELLLRLRMPIQSQLFFLGHHGFFGDAHLRMPSKEYAPPKSLEYQSMEFLLA